MSLLRRVAPPAKKTEKHLYFRLSAWTHRRRQRSGPQGANKDASSSPPTLPPSGNASEPPLLNSRSLSTRQEGLTEGLEACRKGLSFIYCAELPIRPYPSCMNPTSSPTAPNSTESLTYSVAEAAAVLGVSEVTIYRLIYRRLLKPVAGLRHKRISKKQIHALAQGDGHRAE